MSARSDIEDEPSNEDFDKCATWLQDDGGQKMNIADVLKGADETYGLSALPKKKK